MGKFAQFSDEIRHRKKLKPLLVSFFYCTFPILFHFHFVSRYFVLSSAPFVDMFFVCFYVSCNLLLGFDLSVSLFFTTDESRLRVLVKVTVIWDVASCSLGEINQRFRWRLHHHVDPTTCRSFNFLITILITFCTNFSFPSLCRMSQSSHNFFF